MRERFWEKYSLGELSNREWEALCDGCGKCCLKREIDGDRVTVYGVACPLLDIETARCKDYPNRQKKVPRCDKLTASTVSRYNWLPDSCAYRRLDAGKSLPKLRRGRRRRTQAAHEKACHCPSSNLTRAAA